MSAPQPPPPDETPTRVCMRHTQPNAFADRPSGRRECAPPRRRGDCRAESGAGPSAQVKTDFIRSISHSPHGERIRIQGSDTRACARRLPTSARVRITQRSCARYRIRTLRGTAEPIRDGGKVFRRGAYRLPPDNTGSSRHRRTTGLRKDAPFRAVGFRDGCARDGTKRPSRCCFSIKTNTPKLK